MRELRGGVRGFYVLILCIALGVMAIAGVGSFSESLTGGLAREGRTILGGDVAFSLIHREASDNEQQFLQSRGQVSVAATMRAMARASADKMSLVEIKAVDNAYPLVGTTASEPAMPLADALGRARQCLRRAGRSGLAGAARSCSRARALRSAPRPSKSARRLRNEPDKLAGGIGFGPRLLISEAALRATGLVQPGSLVRWHYRVKLPDNDASDRAAAALVSDGRKAIAGSRLGNPHPQQCLAALERNVERFTQFLTLVGLTALLVGGVGVANAVQQPSRPQARHDRGDEIARRDRRARLCHLSDAGAARSRRSAPSSVSLLGAALPFAISSAFGKVIPLPIEPALHPGQLALALLYGLMTALRLRALAAWPRA